MLRAVAGDIAEDLDGVDYVPSYEAVMLTKSNHVWQDDLIHVAGAFVGKIMAYVASNYVKTKDYVDSSNVALFCYAVSSGDWSVADKLFPAMLSLQAAGNLSLSGRVTVLSYISSRRGKEAPR